MEKEKALEKFAEMIGQSWTYEKMTKEEKEKLRDLIYSDRVIETQKGTYKQRWCILQAIYYAYLMGLDYKPIGWRE